MGHNRNRGIGICDESYEGCDSKDRPPDVVSFLHGNDLVANDSWSNPGGLCGATRGQARYELSSLLPDDFFGRSLSPLIEGLQPCLAADPVPVTSAMQPLTLGSGSKVTEADLRTIYSQSKSTVNPCNQWREPEMTE